MNTKAVSLVLRDAVGGGVTGGDNGECDLLCVDCGEGDGERGPSSITGLDGGFTGIRREAALSFIRSFKEPLVGFARSG